MTFEWDVNFFKEHKFKKPKFLTLGVFNKSGAEVLRKDFRVEEEPDYVNLKTNVYSIQVSSDSRPNKILMYLFDEKKEWSKAYEKAI